MLPSIEWDANMCMTSLATSSRHPSKISHVSPACHVIIEYPIINCHVNNAWWLLDLQGENQWLGWFGTLQYRGTVLQISFLNLKQARLLSLKRYNLNRPII